MLKGHVSAALQCLQDKAREGSTKSFCEGCAEARVPNGMPVWQLPQTSTGSPLQAGTTSPEAMLRVLYMDANAIKGHQYYYYYDFLHAVELYNRVTHLRHGNYPFGSKHREDDFDLLVIGPGSVSAWNLRN